MWRESYKIGVHQLDEQHKQLVLRVEDFIDVLHKSPEEQKEECKQLVSFLKDYIVTHFTAEELYQKSIGFPETEQHKKHHAEFADKIREYDIRLIRTKYNPHIIKEFSRYLNKWWIYHIIREDRKMMNFKAK